MYEWQRHIQVIVDEIDACIKRHDDEALALSALPQVGLFRVPYDEEVQAEISGMSFRDYLRQRRLAFALRRCATRAQHAWTSLDYGFSSHEAFTRGRSRRRTASSPAHTKAARAGKACTKINPFGPVRSRIRRSAW